MNERPVRRHLARLFLASSGWTPTGERPICQRFVLIAAPHTSNWDFPLLIAFAEYFEIPISWIGKHTLFRPPMGAVMRALGGIPIDRSKRDDRVAQLARLFDERERLALVVPAEGTRGRVDHWKSGFYHIARTAGVPIVMSYLDYTRKTGGFGGSFEPSGDIRVDMDRVRDFYAGRRGRHPERFGEIRLLEESKAGAPREPRSAALERGQ